LPTTRMTGPERREQLIGVARSVFAERGYQAATVEEIADRAGVTKPVVYQHFGGKEGMHAVVVDRAVTELTSRLSEALDVDSMGLAAHRSASAFLEFIEDHEEAFRVLLHGAPTGDGGGSLGLVIGDIAAKAEHLLATQFADRGFDESTAPMYARMLVGATALVGEWWLEVREPSREVVARHIVNLTWNGLRHLERVDE